MKNFRILAKFLSVILLLSFAACVKKDEEPQVRIVDLQGRAKPVKTRMPELNAKAMAEQGFAAQTRDINQAAPDAGYRNSPIIANNKKEDFGSASAKNMRQVLQPSQEPELVRNQANSENVAAPNMGAGNGNEPIEYDLAEAKQDEAPSKPEIINHHAKKPVKKAVATAEKTTGGKKFFAQVGSFSSKGNAEATLVEMQKFHHGKVEISQGDKMVYRVWLGPFANRNQANAMIKKIKASGHDAVLVRGK